MCIFRNGGFGDSPLMAVYCGRAEEEPRVVTSHSNRLFFTFRSDSSNSGRGFRLYYDGTITGCGGELTSPTGSVISPNYPLHYANSAECFWFIRLARGNLIRITIDDIDLEFESDCSFDAVEVCDVTILFQRRNEKEFVESSIFVVA